MIPLKALRSVSLFLASFSWLLLIQIPAVKASPEVKLFEKLKILTLVIHEVQTKFVEQPDSDEMIYGAIRGLLSTLDPHSSFMTPDEMKDFQDETQGSFSGVGIEISLKDDVLTVVSPIEDTPAYKAGVMAGDQIIKINGELTKSLSLSEAVKLIRGPRGSKVTFTLSRGDNGEVHTISIVREMIPIRSIRSEILEPGYALLRIISFQGDTALEAEKALRAFPRDLKGLIVDLRNNPGGLLDQSINISGLFLGETLVVETKGRLNDQNVKYHSDGPMVFSSSCPIVVLINAGSASASEIVAGALQDHGRALVVGNQSFGKGSVQTVLPLPDGSGLRLTTARFYTPSGHAIQADGITPDIEVSLQLPASVKIMREKDLDGHLAGENERPVSSLEERAQEQESPEVSEEDFPIPPKPLTEMTLAERLEVDTQLAKALTLLREGQVSNTYGAGR